MLEAMYYVTWCLFLAAIAFFGWASVFRADFRKDVFGGKQGEAKVLGLVTVKGAAILIIFGLLLGGIFQIANVANNAEVSDLKSNLASDQLSLEAAKQMITSLQAETSKLIFRPIDEADTPYCDRGIPPSPKPRAVPSHDTEGRPNLALLAQARATASSVIPGMPPGEETQGVESRHRVSFLNDGWYNNCRSWIAKELPAWIAIDLGNIYQVTGIAFGSEYESFYKDRAATKFRIDISLNNIDWDLAYEQKVANPIHDRTVFNFEHPMNAKVVRLYISEATNPNYSTSPGSVRVDELEIFGPKSTK